MGLTKVLTSNKTLQDLDISSARICAQDSELLTRGLWNNTTLQCLRVSSAIEDNLLMSEVKVLCDKGVRDESRQGVEANGLMKINKLVQTKSNKFLKN